MSQRELDTGTDQLRCGVDAHVATLTLNRPEKRNALSTELTPALRASLLELEADADVRVVVITGAGSAFCAGGDVSAMNSRNQQRAANPAGDSVEEDIRVLRRAQEALALRLYDFAKPTVASLPGPAAGAGMSIALACDLRIAADTAFLAPAFATIGLSGDYGGSWLLTQLVGPARAKELYFTSRRVPAREALTLGIFNAVVPADELAARSTEMATAIAAGPPIAQRFMKQNINRAASGDFKACLDLEADRMIRCMRTEDHQAAVAAFLGKRQPTFSGR